MDIYKHRRQLAIQWLGSRYLLAHVQRRRGVR